MLCKSKFKMGLAKAALASSRLYLIDLQLGINRIYRVFFNPVKTNVFLGEAYFHSTRKTLVAIFQLVLKILGYIFCFCILF